MSVLNAKPFNSIGQNSWAHKAEREFDSITHQPYNSRLSNGATRGMVSQVELRSRSPSPSNARDISDDRMPPQMNRSHRREYNCQTTADGDVVVLESSFDANNRAHAEDGVYDSPLSRPSRAHTRNLSAHFFDATKISGDEEIEVTNLKEEKGSVSRESVGHKHRRMFSGGASNPSHAHRRINSIGNAAIVERGNLKGNHHHRENSAGLDILSAVADVSKAELAAIARERSMRPAYEPWQTIGGKSNRFRGSSSSYDYSPSSRDYQVHHSQPHPGFIHGNAGVPPPFHSPHYPPARIYSHPPVHGHYGIPLNSRTEYPAQYPHNYDGYSKHTQFSRHPEVISRSVTEVTRHPELISRSVTEVIDDQYTPSPSFECGRSKIDDQPFRKQNCPPSEMHQHWTGGRGRSQGMHNFSTVNRMDKGTKIVRPEISPKNGSESTGANGIDLAVSSVEGHHRKSSSFSTVLMRSSISSPGPEADGSQPLKSHHRRSGSNASFIKDLDTTLESSDKAFLRNLHASTPNYGSMPLIEHDNNIPNHLNNPTCIKISSVSGTKLAQGGTSKRVRRKCSMDNCCNRVVQGGLCIAHGAKRKSCKHPGCTKNVKQAGLCSTHGPARKRCDNDGCNKVAVQGGRCIAHGAKKKLCSIDNCQKQAILSGMCKRHHDKINGVAAGRGRNLQVCTSDSYPETCVTKDGKQSIKRAHSRDKPAHTRGLSIFQDLSADAIQNLLSAEDPNAPNVEPVSVARPDTETSYDGQPGSFRKNYFCSQSNY